MDVASSYPANRNITEEQLDSKRDGDSLDFGLICCEIRRSAHDVSWKVGETVMGVMPTVLWNSAFEGIKRGRSVNVHGTLVSELVPEAFGQVL